MIEYISFDEFTAPRREERKIQNLPEVEVKSDFGKYLLIGGSLIALYYFVRSLKK